MEFKIKIFNILGGFQKSEYILGYEDFVDIFGGSSQKWTVLGVISMHLGSFLKVKVQIGGIFLVAKIPNIYWGCLKFLIFLGVNGRC